MIPLTLAAATAKPKPADPREEMVTSATLDDGLTVLAVESHVAPVVSVWSWVRAGSRDEPPGMGGAAHFVEHLTYEGAGDFSKAQMVGFVETNGGLWNGYTWLDSTAFYETVPRERLGDALAVEASRLSSATMPATTLDAVRAKVVAEMTGIEDDPAERLDREVVHAAFVAHPYHWAGAGWREDLQKVGRDALMSWYRAHYAPGNTVLVIVGDVKAADAIAAAKTAFAGVAKSDAAPETPTVEPPQLGERRVTVNLPGGARALEVAWHGPAASDPDFPAFLVADAIVGGAKGVNLWTIANRPAPAGSRLAKALLAPGLATAASSRCLPARDPFLEEVAVTLADGADGARSESAAIAAVEQLAAEISSKDVDRARADVLARLTFEAASDTDAGHQLGLFSAIDPANGWRGLFRLPTAVDAVTESDVKRVAAKYFVPMNRTVGWYLPTPQPTKAEATPPAAHVPFVYAVKDGPASVAVPAPVGLSAGGAPAPRAPEPAAHPTPAATPVLPDVGPKVLRQQLPNGLVVLVARNPLAPEVELRVDVAAGAAYELPEKAGIAALVARLLPSGSAAKSESDIADAFANAGATLSVDSDETRASLRAHLLASDLGDLLPLVREMIAGATFPPDSFAREKAAALAEARIREADPRRVAELLLRASLFPDQDPRGRDPLGTSASIANLTRADAGDFQRRAFRPDATIVTISGDVDPNDAARAVSKAFKSWKASGPAPKPSTQPPASLTVGFVGKASLPGATHAEVVYGMPGVARADKDWLPLSAVDLLLVDPVVGGKLTRALGGKPTIAAILSAGDLPGLTGFRAAVPAGTKPDDVAKGITDGLAAAKGGFVDADASLARGVLAGRWGRRLESNAGIAAFLSDAERDKSDARHHEASLQSLTADDLNRALADHLLQNGGTAIVTPK